MNNVHIYSHRTRHSPYSYTYTAQTRRQKTAVGGFLSTHDTQNTLHAVAPPPRGRCPTIFMLGLVACCMHRKRLAWPLPECSTVHSHVPNTNKLSLLIDARHICLIMASTPPHPPRVPSLSVSRARVRSLKKLRPLLVQYEAEAAILRHGCLRGRAASW